MNKTILISLILCLSCIGKDTAFLPDSIAEAKSNNLLISEFNPSNKSLKIGSSRYLIEQAFTTVNINSRRDRRINPNFFAFVLVIKSLETGAYGLDLKDGANYDQFIKFPCEFCGGIIDQKIVIHYDDFRNREKLDSVKLGFISESNEKQTVVFVRK